MQTPGKECVVDMDEYFSGWEATGYLKQGKIIYWEEGISLASSYKYIPFL